MHIILVFKWKNIYVLENWMEKPDLLMKKSLSNCNVNELKVLWISSGRAEPLHSFRSMLLSIGPSHTFKMSWATSVSKTIKCRLQRENKAVHITHYTQIHKTPCNHSQTVLSFEMVFRTEGGLVVHFSCWMSWSCKRDATLFYKCLNYRKHHYRAYSTCSIS